MSVFAKNNNLSTVVAHASAVFIQSWNWKQAPVIWYFEQGLRLKNEEQYTVVAMFYQPFFSS